MRVLITGVAGLTGAHLAKHCLENGDEVVGIDNFFRGAKSDIKSLLANKHFTFHECDFRDYIKNNPKAEYDGIYHLAAVLSTRNFYEDPALVYEVNCHGTYEIFKWAISNRIPRFVNASSSEVYGHANELPTKETAQSIYDSVETTTRWSYAHAKKMTEYILNDYKNEISVCHLRYANVYGPFEVDDDIVIPYILSRIASNKQCNLNVRAKEIKRCFLYISDCIEATRLAMLKMRSGLSYNIGNPEEITIYSLFFKAVETMGKLGCNYDIEPVFDLVRPGDPERRILDIGRAKEQLGYSPKVMLDEGLMRTAEWTLKQQQ